MNEMELAAAIQVRPYRPEDRALLEKTDPFGLVELSYNQDVLQDEAYTALREGQPVGVLFFLRHFSWYGDKEPHHRLMPYICTSDREVRQALLRFAAGWLGCHSTAFAGKRPALAFWADSADLSLIQNYMEAGFTAYNPAPRLRMDLASIPDHPVPDGVTVEKMEMRDEAIREYIEATAAANEGTPDSEHQLRFIAHEPSFRVYNARVDGRFAASVSVWRISGEVSAVENIFCLPEFRRRGITRGLMVYAMTQARAAGYRFGELGMFGRNLRAQRLYYGMGFRLHSMQLELLLPTNTPDQLYLP